MRATAILALGTAALLALPVEPARAEPARAEPAQILFEDRGGAGAARDAAANGLIAKLREELRQREVLVEPRAIAELPNELLPLAGMWDRELELPALTAQLDAGVRAYLRGQFSLAARQLEAALALARRNPALVVSDPSAPRWMTQAMVALALTRQRLRQRAEARAAMAEQVRSFPELAVTVADFGSRGAALYGEVRTALEAGPRGGLIVDVSDPDARIYLNEQGRGRGGAFSSDLLPGAYRVLVMVGGRSRLYRLSVHANEQTRLSVDWAADLRFEASPAWIGLRPAGARRHAREHRRLARRLAFNDAIVVGFGRVDGAGVIDEVDEVDEVDAARGAARQLWGAVYERGSGRSLRRGAIGGARAGAAGSAGGGDGEVLARFAEFLRSGRYSREFAIVDAERARDAGAARAEDGKDGKDGDGGDDGDDVVPRGAGALASGRARSARIGPPAAPRPAAADRSPARSTGAIAVAALGLAAIGGGAYFALQASRDSCAECDEDRASTWAIAMISGGVVSLGVATFLVFEARRGPTLRGRAALGLQPLLRGGVATLGWQF
jgi:hypothetical protein